jgi:hypothetical protein
MSDINTIIDEYISSLEPIIKQNKLIKARIQTKPDPDTLYDRISQNRARQWLHDLQIAVADIRKGYGAGDYAVGASGKSYSNLNQERTLAEERSRLNAIKEGRGYEPTPYEIGMMKNGEYNKRKQSREEYLTRIFETFKYVSNALKNEGKTLPNISIIDTKYDIWGKDFYDVKYDITRPHLDGYPDYEIPPNRGRISSLETYQMVQRQKAENAYQKNYTDRKIKGGPFYKGEQEYTVWRSNQNAKHEKSHREFLAESAAINSAIKARKAAEKDAYAKTLKGRLGTAWKTIRNTVSPYLPGCKRGDPTCSTVNLTENAAPLNLLPTIPSNYKPCRKRSNAGLPTEGGHRRNSTRKSKSKTRKNNKNRKNNRKH